MLTRICVDQEMIGIIIHGLQREDIYIYINLDKIEVYIHKYYVVVVVLLPPKMEELK